MVVKLVFVWFLGVVAFFVLWALLAKLFHRISEKKQKNQPSVEETDEMTISKKT